MTFGEVLRELLDVTGIKQAHLASRLGYDVSYINKWVSGAKRPSLRCNAPALEKMAEYMSGELSPEGIDRLNKAFPEARQTGEGGSVCEWVHSLLVSGCELQEKPRPSGGKSYEGTSLAPAAQENYDTRFIIDSLAEYSYHSSQPELKVFIMAPIYDYGHGECKPLWSQIDKELSPDSRVHVSLIVSFTGVTRKHIADICEDVIVFLFGLPARIELEIFQDPCPGEHENEKYIWMCEDAFLFTSYWDAFTKKSYIMRTKDKALCREYYGAMRSYLRGSRSIIQKSGFEPLLESKFFHMLFVNGGFSSLHTVMPLFLADRRLFSSVSRGLGFPETLLDLYDKLEHCAEARVTVIYRTAITKFTFDGTVSLFGRTTSLSPEDRKALLQALLAKEKAGRSRLIIAEDTNPVLDSADINCSIFIGGRSMYAARLPWPDQAPPSGDIVFSDSPELIEAFQIFMETFAELQPPYVLKDSAAISYLEQCRDQI